MADWISVQGQLNWVKNSKTCFLCDVTKRKSPTQIKQLFLKSKLEDLLNPWMVWTAL